MKRVVFTSRMFKIEKEDMVIKGRRKTVERNLRPKTVVVVPLLGRDTVLLERQYRPAIRKHIFELPAGIIDAGEDAAHAARREVEEETGCRPSRVKFLFKAHPSPGLSTEEQNYYLATGLKKTKIGLGEMEVIKTTPVRVGRLLKMIKDNQIADNKTIAGVLYFVNFVR